MRSFTSRCRSFPALASATFIALGLLSACDPSDIQEVIGGVETLPDGDSPAGQSIPFKAFSDDVGSRAQVETRALITSRQAYADYFGHAPPSGLDLGREWVVFYSAGGRSSGGFDANVQSVTLATEGRLRVVTHLGTPGRCPVDLATTTPFVLIRFPAQKTSSVEFLHRESVARCDEPGPGCELVDCPEACVERDGRAQCVPFPNPCAAILCGPGSQCIVKDGKGECAPIANPCAATTCPAGSECVVLESFPPQAKCVPIAKTCTSTSECGAGLICSTELMACAQPACEPNKPCPPVVCTGTCVPKPDPEPKRCFSSNECGAGLRCSTERGDCQSACGLGSGVACPAVCAGVCEAIPQPAQCRTDSDCRAEGDYCGGCNCVARGVNDPIPLCAVDTVQCFAEPCLGQKAVCNAGKCELTKAQPTPVCDWQLLGSETACKSADEWKRAATDACALKGGTLRDLSVGGGDCRGGTRYAKYECCTP